MLHFLQRSDADIDTARYVRQMLPSLIMLNFTATFSGTLNTFMAARFSIYALGGIGQAETILIIFTAMYSAYSVGTMVATASRHGLGRDGARGSSDSAVQGILSGLPIVLALSLLLVLLRRPLLTFLFRKAEAQIMECSIEYFFWAALSLPLCFISFQLSAALRGTSDAKTPLRIDLISSVVGIGSIALLMFGLNGRWGINGLGVTGMGIGLVIWRLFNAAYYILHLYGKRSALRLPRPGDIRVNPKQIREIVSVGLPAALENILFQIGRLLIQVMVTGMGTEIISANQIMWSLHYLFIVPLNALCTIGTTIVGKHVGMGDNEGARRSLGYMLHLSVLWALCLCLVSVGTAPFLPRLYTNDKALLSICVPLLVVQGPMFFLWIHSFIRSNALYGAKDSKFVFATAVSSTWVFRVFVGYLFGVVLGWGLYALWGAMFLDWAARGTIYLFHIRSGKWLKHAKPAEV